MRVSAPKYASSSLHVHRSCFSSKVSGRRETPLKSRPIRRWLGALYGVGYLGGGWPVEWGGRAGHRPVHDLIVMEELYRARAYRPLEQAMMAAQGILDFGTEAQKYEYLPRIRRGEHIWCQLFSEPDAGSDLAALRTRAEPTADGFVVTGQKVWNTDAHWADMGILIARTDAQADRHAGLTIFLVPMRLAGIEVRPLREMTGSAEFCEVFFDGLRLEPRHVLGEVDDGWHVITAGLATERAAVGANAVQLEMMFDDLVALARAVRYEDGRAAIDHADVRARLGQTMVNVEASKLIVLDIARRALTVDEHASDGPLAKLSYTEVYVELCEHALQLLSSASSTDEAASQVVARWYEAFLWSRRADGLRRIIGDHARFDRPATSRPAAGLDAWSQTSEEVRSCSLRLAARALTAFPLSFSAPC